MWPHCPASSRLRRPPAQRPTRTTRRGLVRADAFPNEAGATASRQIADRLERSASPAVEARGTSTTPSRSLVATNTATGWLDDAATAKPPSGWGPGAATKKGVGTRRTDPANPGSGVRIDQGNPLNTQITQQVDHVVVRYNGQVIGRNGQPITGSISQNAEQAHIPLTEWQTWNSWFAP